MKRFFLLILALGILTFPGHCLGDAATTQTPTPSPSHDLETSLASFTKYPDKLPGSDQEGERGNQVLIFCSISKEHGVQTDPTLFGIISYEIRDENGMVYMASFLDELSFVNAVFALSEGSYQIRLETAECYYCGIITIY